MGRRQAKGFRSFQGRHLGHHFSGGEHLAEHHNVWPAGRIRSGLEGDLGGDQGAACGRLVNLQAAAVAGGPFAHAGETMAGWGDPFSQAAPIILKL